MTTMLTIGVTGTNGKTSVTSFVRQLCEAIGLPAAALGQRLEVRDKVLPRKLVGRGKKALPDYVRGLSSEGVCVVSIEAYSAALASGAHDLMAYDAVAFTNLAEDHLALHGSCEAYHAAKRRLLKLTKPGAPVVLGPAMRQEAFLGGLKARHAICVPRHYGKLSFAEENIAIARTIVNEAVIPVALLPNERDAANNTVAKALSSLQPPPGRMEIFSFRSARVIVDFAHNAHGLARVLADIKPHTSGRLSLLLSSKGGWDTAKRRELSLAANAADEVIVTDDDPGAEDPALIRDPLVTQDRTVIPDRRRAIAISMARLRAGDVLLVAGRGADTAWIGPQGRYHFSDVEVVQSLGARRASSHADNAIGYGGQG